MTYRYDTDTAEGLFQFAKDTEPLAQHARHIALHVAEDRAGMPLPPNVVAFADEVLGAGLALFSHLLAVEWGVIAKMPELADTEMMAYAAYVAQEIDRRGENDE